MSAEQHQNTGTLVSSPVLTWLIAWLKHPVTAAVVLEIPTLRVSL